MDKHIISVKEFKIQVKGGLISTLNIERLMPMPERVEAYRQALVDLEMFEDDEILSLTLDDLDKTGDLLYKVQAFNKLRDIRQEKKELLRNKITKKLHNAGNFQPPKRRPHP